MYGELGAVHISAYSTMLLVALCLPLFPSEYSNSLDAFSVSVNMRIYSVKVFIYCQQLCIRVIQVHLNKLECCGKVHLFSNSTQIEKLVY